MLNDRCRPQQWITKRGFAAIVGLWQKRGEECRLRRNEALIVTPQNSSALIVPQGFVDRTDRTTDRLRLIFLGLDQTVPCNACAKALCSACRTQC